MKSQLNTKQRDRVASYSGGTLNKVNAGGPSVQVNQKKKPYRARGCRGGASRKGRKKQPIIHTGQNEENDPSRLNNNNSDKLSSYNAQAPKECTEHQKPVAMNDHETKHANSGSGVDASKMTTQDHHHNKARALSILPNVGGLDANQGPSGHATASNEDFNLVDQAQSHIDSTFIRSKPILPGVLTDSATRSTNKRVHALSAIARPSSASSGGKSDGNSGGGFSFFCISPRSFLSGTKKAKTPKLN